MAIVYPKRNGCTIIKTKTKTNKRMDKQKTKPNHNLVLLEYFIKKHNVKKTNKKQEALS